MVVQHNLQAMNANRMLNVTTGQQAKSTEKLSSGYRINRAADDAAGLTISEKMRKQIRGLDQASTNAQDGVSAVQTAEGALTEVHSMLQRMNELAVQSANGTNAQSDRQAIQDEIDQLATEIDRVSETTKFNEIYLLKGDTKTASKANFMKSTYVMGKDLFAKGGKTKLSADQLKEELAKGNRVYTVAEANAGDQTDANIAEAGKDYVYATKLYDAKGKEVSAEQIADSKNADGSTATNYYVNEKGAVANAIAITAADAKAKNIQPFDVNGELSFNLHVGADSAADNKIAVKIESMSAAGIGVNPVSVIQIWLKRWLTTARTTFLHRQVSLCLHRLISLLRECFLCYSNLCKIVQKRSSQFCGLLLLSYCCSFFNSSIDRPVAREIFSKDSRLSSNR